MNYANEPKFFYSQEYGDHMVDYDEELLLVSKKIYSKLKLSHNLNNLITQLKITLMKCEEIIYVFYILFFVF